MISIMNSFGYYHCEGPVVLQSTRLKSSVRRTQACVVFAIIVFIIDVNFLFEYQFRFCAAELISREFSGEAKSFHAFVDIGADWYEL